MIYIAWKLYPSNHSGREKVLVPRFGLFPGSDGVFEIAETFWEIDSLDVEKRLNLSMAWNQARVMGNIRILIVSSFYRLNNSSLNWFSYYLPYFSAIKTNEWKYDKKKRDKSQKCIWNMSLSFLPQNSYFMDFSFQKGTNKRIMGIIAVYGHKTTSEKNTKTT